jgi:selenobiotic family peptide radical SAM maturase
LKNQKTYEPWPQLKQVVKKVRESKDSLPAELTEVAINPTLELVQAPGPAPEERRKGLAPDQAVSEGGGEMHLVMVDPSSKEVVVRPASATDLLALKVTAEKLDPLALAKENDCPVGAIDGAIREGVASGILLAPPPRICRDTTTWESRGQIDPRFLRSDGFTLQWHLTQSCDLHCRHCYDRSNRESMKTKDSLALLESFRRFCRSHFVEGHIAFTGGNPLLHPSFFQIYERAAELGFTATILGNPTDRQTLDRIVSINNPWVYQVSLEGLEAHNDSIRGEGNFRSVTSFLRLLKEQDVSTMVMLTLTEANLEQVLPLAKHLEGLADDFHFNRLSCVGEGAALQPADPERFAAFLHRYHRALSSSPNLGLKENLFNRLRHESGEKPFGGCTGFGCGAAFNFIAVLPDGEAHACRKFPSPIGNVLKEGLEAVYHSPRAGRYRQGCSTCSDCDIRAMCGGCLAVAYGQGLDPLVERDPYCLKGAVRLMGTTAEGRRAGGEAHPVGEQGDPGR